jgi:hypothetical protein
VLEVDDRDLGCAATRRVLERYVETEVGAQAAGARFPGISVHLTTCRACRTERDGLMALIERELT